MPCRICKEPYPLKGNLRHCENCYNPNGYNRKYRYEKKNQPTKEDWILHLLKSQKADMSMIRAYSKCSIQMVRQYITNLRKKGHHISLTGDFGWYEYVGYFP